MKTVYSRTKLVEKQTEDMDPGAEVDKMWNDVHNNNAREMREHAQNEKGLLIKACQFMSSLAGVLPDPYVNEFQVLQEELPVSRIEEILHVIQTDLKRKPKEIFSVFNPEPIASASIAQVHRAQLRPTLGGQDSAGDIVAVKIQHDGVDNVFLEDVGTLSVVAKQVAYWVPSLDFTKFCLEWSESLPRELNFAEERRALERAREALNRAGNLCILPKVYSQFSGRHVLVMEFIDAQPIMNLADPEFCKTHNLDKQVILTHFLNAFGVMAFKDGLFHADPHAGNVRLKLDPNVPGGARPVLFDWGFFRELTNSERLGMAKVFHCTANFDMAGLFECLAHLGTKFKPELLTDDFRRDFLEKARSMMKDTVDKNQTRQEVLKAFSDYKARLAKEGGDASYSPLHFLEDWPRCIVFFMRMLQIVRGLCVSVDAIAMPVLDIFAQHAREALVESSTQHSITSSIPMFVGREAAQQPPPPGDAPVTLAPDPTHGFAGALSGPHPAKFATSHAEALKERLEARLAVLTKEQRVVGA